MCPPSPSSVPRHFLELTDLTGPELRGIVARGRGLKSGEEGEHRPLRGKILALLFRKRSTRTRVSFEVAIHQLGGHTIFMSDQDSQMGRGESMADTARVLTGYVDGIMIRTFHHDEVVELARYAGIPVINSLTDRVHPCQLLADLMVLEEEFGGDIRRLRVAWVGDGNNVANSWLNAASLLGFELRLAVPEGYDPDPGILARARAAAPVVLTRDPAEAVAGAHAVTTDVWASMGQEAEAEGREAVFRTFQVDAALIEGADPGAIFLHCLPAHRGEEVTAEVIDGPRSRVFQQSENRLHGQKALLLHLMADAGGPTP
jgi:ornithine carbamoyltransferase